MRCVSVGGLMQSARCTHACVMRLEAFKHAKACAHTMARAHMCASTRKNTHAHACTRMHTHARIYTYTRTQWTYTHTHTHTHTHTLSGRGANARPAIQCNFVRGSGVFPRPYNQGRRCAHVHGPRWPPEWRGVAMCWRVHAASPVHTCKLCSSPDCACFRSASHCMKAGVVPQQRVRVRAHALARTYIRAGDTEKGVLCRRLWNLPRRRMARMRCNFTG